LQALANEAAALSRELRTLDAEAKSVTESYRRAGTLALREGKPLPPAPVEIGLLQARRTGAMVKHAVNLQARLKSNDAASLEALLAYSFAR
jgi:hypothetical protein